MNEPFIQIANRNFEEAKTAQIEAAAQAEVSKSEAFWLGVKCGGGFTAGFFLLLVVIGVLGG